MGTIMSLSTSAVEASGTPRERSQATASDDTGRRVCPLRTHSSRWFIVATCGVLAGALGCLEDDGARIEQQQQAAGRGHAASGQGAAAPGASGGAGDATEGAADPGNDDASAAGS